MNARSAFPALLTFLALCGVPSQAARINAADYQLELVPYDIRIRDYQFPSGLRIVFQEDHSRPLVSVTSVIDAGSIEDPVGMDGLAHLVEHLNFRAIHGDLPKNMDLIKQIGGAFNATTSEDRTNYLSIAPKDALVPLLRLESLRLLDAVEGVTEEVLNVEREVVRNELRGNLEQGPGDVWGLLSAQLYPAGHPNSRTTIGKHETLNNITLADIQAWVQKWYRPEHTTIVVVGDFSLEDTPQFIQDAFAYAQLSDPKNPQAELTMVEQPPRMSGAPPEPPPPVSQELVHHKAMVDTPTILMGWSLPGGFRGQDAQWSLTVQMMNYAVGKYLFPSWDYENEDIEAFGCFYSPGRVSSQAYCYIEISESESPERVVRKALDGLYELWNTDNFYQMQRGQVVQGSIPMDQLFKLSKLSWMAGLFLSVEDVSNLFGRGDAVSQFLHFTGNPAYYSAQFGELSTVDPYQAGQIAYQYLNRDRYAAVVLDPLTDEEKALAERKGLEGTYDGVTRADQGALIFEAGELTDDAIRQAVVPPDLSNAREFTLENGLRVVIVPGGEAPVARTRLLVNVGRQNVQPDGLYALMDHMGNWDYEKSPLEFAGSRTLAATDTTTAVDVVGSAGNVRAQVSEVRVALDSWRMEMLQVGEWVKDTKKSRDKDEKKPETWASRLLWSSTLPGHRLGSYLTDADLEARKKLTRGQAQALAEAMYDPSRAVLLVVGNVDAEAAEQAVRELLGDLKPAPAAEVDIREVALPPEPGPRRILVFDKPGTTQADISFMCQLPEATLENQATRQVLADVYSETLWRELRETAGTTYGAYAYQGDYRGGLAYLAGGTLIQNRSVDLAVKTFLDGLQEIRDGKVDPDLLQTFKWNLGRSATISYQTTSQVLSGLSGYLSRGWSHRDALTYGERLSAVQVGDLPGLLDRCIGHEVITIVGTSDEMVREVEEAGYTAEVVDWNALIQNPEKDKKKAKK